MSTGPSQSPSKNLVRSPYHIFNDAVEMARSEAYKVIPNCEHVISEPEPSRQFDNDQWLRHFASLDPADLDPTLRLHDPKTLRPGNSHKQQRGRGLFSPPVRPALLFATTIGVILTPSTSYEVGFLRALAAGKYSLVSDLRAMEAKRVHSTQLVLTQLRNFNLAALDLLSLSSSQSQSRSVGFTANLTTGELVASAQQKASSLLSDSPASRNTLPAVLTPNPEPNTRSNPSRPMGAQSQPSANSTASQTSGNSHSSGATVQPALKTALKSAIAPFGEGDSPIGLASQLNRLPPSSDSSDPHVTHCISGEPEHPTATIHYDQRSKKSSCTPPEHTAPNGAPFSLGMELPLGAPNSPEYERRRGESYAHDPMSIDDRIGSPLAPLAELTVLAPRRAELPVWHELNETSVQSNEMPPEGTTLVTPRISGNSQPAPVTLVAEVSSETPSAVAQVTPAVQPTAPESHGTEKSESGLLQDADAGVRQAMALIQQGDVTTARPLLEHSLRLRLRTYQPASHDGEH